MIRIGKAGIERRTGKDLDALRTACYERDGYCCRQCGRRVVRRPIWEVTADRAEMAHLRGKRNHGDTLANVRTLCFLCHHQEHNPKAVPRKEARG